jgi:hypothetical protein
MKHISRSQALFTAGWEFHPEILEPTVKVWMGERMLIIDKDNVAYL